MRKRTWYEILDNGCWNCTSHGPYSLHRFTYKKHHGINKIPKGMVIMHSCDNPRCINPLHLQLGTQNILDSFIKGRHNRKEKPEKELFTKDGKRVLVLNLPADLVDSIRSIAKDECRTTANQVKYILGLHYKKKLNKT